jgi:hypothetical protein
MVSVSSLETSLLRMVDVLSGRTRFLVPVGRTKTSENSNNWKEIQINRLLVQIQINLLLVQKKTILLTPVQ